MVFSTIESVHVRRIPHFTVFLLRTFVRRRAVHGIIRKTGDADREKNRRKREREGVNRQRQGNGRRKEEYHFSVNRPRRKWSFPCRHRLCILIVDDFHYMIIHSLLCPKSATVISDICTRQFNILHHMSFLFFPSYILEKRKRTFQFFSCLSEFAFYLHFVCLLDSCLPFLTLGPHSKTGGGASL